VEDGFGWLELTILLYRGIVPKHLMASTRSKNTLGDYATEQQYHRHVEEYKSYKNSASGTPFTTCIPDVGYMPSNVSRETFASNAIDIESMLRGTGESNLVTPKEPVVASKITVPYKSFFKRPTQLVPEPLVIEKYQRPNLRG